MTIEKIKSEIKARIEKLECDDVNAWHKCTDVNVAFYKQREMKEEKTKLERAFEVLK